MNARTMGPATWAPNSQMSEPAAQGQGANLNNHNKHFYNTHFVINNYLIFSYPN